MRERRAQHDRGFSLIELLVVILIIGVLSAIAVPVYLDQRRKATDAALRADMRQARTIMDTYILDGQTINNGAGTACFSATECAEPGQIADVMTSHPLDLKLSPGNAIGDFWGGWYGTYHLCIEHSNGGQPQEWYAIDTYDGNFEVGRGSTGGCPWVSMGGTT